MPVSDDYAATVTLLYSGKYSQVQICAKVHAMPLEENVAFVHHRRSLTTPLSYTWQTIAETVAC